jgi:hypothetical protein
VKQFNSKTQENKAVIEFELDGHTYYFTPVKQSTQLVKLLTVKTKGMEADLERVGSMFDWLAAGLDREYYKAYQKDPDAQPAEDSQWKHLMGRLEDPDDNLELDTVTEVITWLMGEVSGRPTT